MPFNGPLSEAFFIAALTSSFAAFFSTCATRSTTETFGVGTRMANPSSFPAISGMTSFRAFAAPVVVGIMDSAAARAPQVFVGKVENDLIVGIGVNGRHGAADDLEIVINHFDDRRQAIGGAGGIRNNVVLGGIVFILIHAENHREVFVLCRRGDDDFLHRAAQMFFCFVGVGEAPG